MYKFYCRVYQSIYKAVSYLLPWRKPELFEGENSLIRLPKVIKELDIKSVLIVTDKVIFSLGLLDDLLEGLRCAGIKFVVYKETVPNPTIDNIEAAVDMYKLNTCEAIIAFGGGSCR